MSMSVVETGHRELPMQVNHASIRAQPGFYLCIAVGSLARDRDNEFSANRHSARPRLCRETGVDLSPGENEVGRRLKWRGLRSSLRELRSARHSKTSPKQRFTRQQKFCTDQHG